MDMEPEQEIENRSVRSGASKRKKRKEQLDALCQLNVFRPCRMRVCTLLTRV